MECRCCGGDPAASWVSFLASVRQGGYPLKRPDSFVCTCTDIEDTHHDRVYSKQRNIGWPPACPYHLTLAPKTVRLRIQRIG